jgi:hypothetical protein
VNPSGVLVNPLIQEIKSYKKIKQPENVKVRQKRRPEQYI